jgi:ankyrin repeat protein
MKFNLGHDLYEACVAGDLARVEEVLTASDQSCLAWRHPNGWTALHAAIEARNTVLVGRLIAAGAKISATDSVGDTPLHHALHVELEGRTSAVDDAYGGRLVLTRLLLDAGADPLLPGSDRTPAIGLARLYKSAEAEHLLVGYLKENLPYSGE